MPTVASLVPPPRFPIGAVVRTVRLDRGVTQVELAKALGISTGALSKIENAENVHTRTLFRCLKAVPGVHHLSITYETVTDEIVSICLDDLADS